MSVSLISLKYFNWLVIQKYILCALFRFLSPHHALINLYSKHVTKYVIWRTLHSLALIMQTMPLEDVALSALLMLVNVVYHVTYLSRALSITL